jgi:hypothetical protein
MITNAGHRVFVSTAVRKVADIPRTRIRIRTLHPPRHNSGIIDGVCWISISLISSPRHVEEGA